MAPVSIFQSREAMMAAAAAAIAEALRFALAARGSGCAALSGGATPGPAYGLADRMPLPWPKITLALVDERFVAPSEPASNERLVRDNFATALAAGAGFAPMFSNGALDTAAERADQLYKDLHLDIAVMGMGADGHTASWFPRAANLAALLDLAQTRSVASVRSIDAHPVSDRLTLTRAAVARADRLLLLITGEDKRARLEAGDAPIAALFSPEMPPCDILYAP
jgi:6-phosphogluconolactonase